MAQLMSRENRLLNARRQLQILFICRSVAQPRIARGEVSLEGEDPRPGVQPRPQLALLYRFAEKIIGPGLKPCVKSPVFAGGEQYQINIATKLATANFPA